MQQRKRLFSIALILIFLTGAAFAQDPITQNKKQAIIASEMKDNRFVIKTNAPSVKVSWMVTGVRHDVFADKHRVKVEEVKAEQERGYYLHPEVFNQPEEKSIEWARHPEMRQRLKQQRLEAEEKSKKQQPQ